MGIEFLKIKIVGTLSYLTHTLQKLKLGAKNARSKVNWWRFAHVIIYADVKYADVVAAKRILLKLCLWT